MGKHQILVASNRGPVSFALGDDGRLTARRGGGGLVSGLSSVVGSDPDALWICAALTDADRAAARHAPGGRLDLDGHDIGAAVQMLDIPPVMFHRAYNGVANSTLWFVHHLLYDMPNRPHFGLAWQREWESYRSYNAAFATALASGASAATDERADGTVSGTGRGNARALVQDYHLTLVPRMLRDAHPALRIAHFSHTPWAPPDYYQVLPDRVARQVLDGILGADHAGFLCDRWARAFLACCAEFLDADVDMAHRTVAYRGRVTRVEVHALGVDGAELRARASATDVGSRMQPLREVVGDRKLIVRIDRTELSKNIVRGLAAYRELLATRPQWHGRVVHLAFAYPSRHDLPEYREYTASVLRIASEIEDEFGTDDWNPLLLDVNDDYPRSLAAYRLADVLLVNPIRDGMNLVAKEGPVLAERGCALVLSRTAGAAAELGDDALLVNPFDISATADALHRALTMSSSERLARCARLKKAATALPPRKWFADQLRALG
ncbi:MAG TPA: trehalose-6-phosphate synthase [Streptosporangiaceae bacterium]|nr:trehalose-6-phosphate synthase [Streptosporangiaceae bacterium]